MRRSWKEGDGGRLGERAHLVGAQAIEEAARSRQVMDEDKAIAAAGDAQAADGSERVDVVFMLLEAVDGWGR